MATGGVGLHTCPLCNAPVEGGDQLQLHYLTSCSGYDHGDTGVGGASSNKAHTPPAPPSSSSSVTSAPAVSPGATARGGVVPGNQHLIQFMWQPLTQMSYPKVTLLTSLESGSIDLRLDKDAADGGFYCSDRVLVGEGVYEGQLVVGDSFINPVKKFTVDSGSAGIVVLEFELSGRGDSGVAGGGGAGDMRMQPNPSFNQRPYGYSGGPAKPNYHFSRGKTGISAAGTYEESAATLAAANNNDVTAPLTPPPPSSSSTSSSSTRHTLTTASHPHQASEERVEPAVGKTKPSQMAYNISPSPSHGAEYETNTATSSTAGFVANDRLISDVRPGAGGGEGELQKRRSSHPGGVANGSNRVASDWGAGRRALSQIPLSVGEENAGEVVKMTGRDHDRERDDGFSVNSIQNRRSEEDAARDYEEKLCELRERLGKVTEEKEALRQDRERVSALWEGKVQRLKRRLKEGNEGQGVEHNEQLEDELEETKSQLEASNARMASLSAKLQEKEGEREVKEAVLKEMKNMNAALENQLTEYMDALDHQNKSVQRSVATSNTSSAELAKAEKESAEMIVYMRKQQLEYQEALEALQRKVGRAEEVEEENMKIHQINLNLTGELEDYRHQTKSLLAELRKKEEEVVGLQQQKSKLGSSERSQLELESMRQKCEAWREEVEKLSPLRDQLAHLQQDNSRLQQEVGILADNNARLTGQLQQALSGAGGKGSGEREREKGELERKAVDYDQLMERVTELQQVRVQLENELSPLRAERASILSENAALREGSQPEKHLQLKNDFTRMKEQLAVVQASLSSESNECEQLRKRLADEAAISRRMDEANHELQQQLQASTDEKSLQAIRDRMERYRKEREDLKVKVSQMQADLQVYQAREEENQTVIEQLKMEAAANLEAGPDQGAVWEQQLDSLVAKLEESNKRVHRYREERNSARIMLKSFEEQVNTLQNTVEQLRNSRSFENYTSEQLESAIFTQLHDDSSPRTHEAPSSPRDDTYSPDIYSEQQLHSPYGTSQNRTGSGPKRTGKQASSVGPSPSGGTSHKTRSSSSGTGGANTALFTEVLMNDGVTRQLLIERPNYKLNYRTKPEVVVKRKGGNFESGVLTYLGVLDGKEMAGVFLDLPNGNNDGAYKDGKYYFRCTPSHGLYCPLSNIYVEANSDSV